MSTPVGGVLDAITLFDVFTPDERAAVAARGRWLDLPADTTLMREGEAGEAMFIVLDGEVRVRRRDPVGDDVELAVRGPGCCFGEMALIDGGPRSATVVTASACRLFVLDRATFTDVLDGSPPLRSKLLRDLSRKVRDASERLVREDLTGRMRAAEAELARHRAIVQAVTGLAHELNTPLGICVTTASHIEAMAETGDAALLEPAALLRGNLGRAVALVEAFTAIAALSGEPAAELDLVEMIDHAVGLFAMEHPDRPLSVRFENRVARPWRGYRGHLETALVQILDNVATHAYPSHPQGGVVEITIEEGAHERRPAWLISLKDFGVGVAPDARGKLFDAFFTTRRAAGHKGLGLTIVYNAVTGPLGGRVSVESEPGEGARVTLVLPRAP